MRIRSFEPRDAGALAQLFHAAVHQIARMYYSRAQVLAWAPAVPDEARFRARAADGRTLLVAVDEADAPLAYGDVERNGHIDHLFCRPDVAGTGVTAALYTALEAAAVEQGIDLLFVEASEPARRFFAKQGFSLIERRDFEIGGVPIHNYRMEKKLGR
ncbi:GNAT family N-acetyltransferase [Nannocystis sp. ILAH1]|uniref:GNAT family N-acetyltransferase n=1 Tax=Nannocystis sp. ILAH1 TaxID=2996789 RepID=UPI00226E3198|nr:GNAT family N-acetyltransferase [Nannocystis sp. ILAH1]MCY0991034.1 GNAT family N-acetyltransferase [Nannocystis sp. ILAH1]